MRNCLIMGSGRSGTSMMAGVLAKSGYFMGRNLIPPRPANPKGFFESSQINRDINEVLIRSKISNLTPGHGWIAVSSLIPPKGNPIVRRRVINMVTREPFCYKDPRFCYTLPFWKPSLKNTNFICVFRHPASTATSIVKECKTAKYLKNTRMDIGRAFQIWMTMYKLILDKLSKSGTWMFVSYDQLFDKESLDKVQSFLDLSTIDHSFPEKRFVRPVPNIKTPPVALAMYAQLCRMANQ